MTSLLNTLTAQKHHNLTSQFIINTYPPKYYLENSVDQGQLVSEN